MGDVPGGRKKPNAEAKVFSSDIVEEIRELFSKVFTYTKPSSGEWSLPDASESFVHKPHRSLQDLKQSLNNVKDQLSDKNLEVWHQHTSFTNKAGKVTAHIRATANAEICTQAWCKFYEILGKFQLLPDSALQTGELNTVHLCEAPGAFIASLNHYLKSNFPYCDWTWVANTLNPYYEGNDCGTMITDDRLIAATLPWWFFGSEDNGDLMLQKHLLELQQFTMDMQVVHLVTADGSFDCQGNPDEQEALVAPLHYCETIAALLLLGNGGSFVLKMFTLYEHSSICLLYLLNCCFHIVHVFKPGTSKAGNSEVYVVCVNYCAKNQVKDLLSKMIRNFGPDITHCGALFPGRLIPKSFLEQHKKTCQYFHDHQVKTIQENLQLFKSMSDEQKQRLILLRECAAEFYVSHFQVRHLPRRKWLTRNAALCGKLPCQRKQVGSFNERKQIQKMAWNEKVQKGCYTVYVEGHTLQALGADCVLEGPAEEWDWRSWYTLVGAVLTKVQSSPFCDLELLNQLNEALENSEWVKRHHSSVDNFCCSQCFTLGPSVIASELFKLCSTGGSQEQEGTCFLIGAVHSQIPDVGLSILELCPEPVCPTTGRTILHDGDPQYQLQLFGCVLNMLKSLGTGTSVILPILSAFTRVTANLLLVLHHCFRTVSFRCPTTSNALGPVATLLCVDFQQHFALGLLPVLEEVHRQMSECGEKQVLQFVPMDVLLKGALPDFLWNMNTAIARHRLHLLLVAERVLMAQ